MTTCVQSQVVGSVFVDFKAPQDGGGPNDMKIVGQVHQSHRGMRAEVETEADGA